MNLRYICQNCGGDTIWDANKAKIICENCGSEVFSYEVEDKCPSCNSELKYNDKESFFYCTNCDYKIQEESLETLEQKRISEYKEDDLGTFDSNIYNCSSCGAEIIVEQNTVATKCPFCNSNIQISQNLIGSAKPYGIIPFKQTKEDVQIAFKNWCKKWIMMSKDFLTLDRI